MASNRPVEIVDTLHEWLPQVFEDRHLPDVLEREWIIVPIPDPESPEVEEGSEVLWEDMSDPVGLAESVPWVPTLEGRFPGSPVQQNTSAYTQPPDALVFYLPFHYYYHKGWGVYVSADGASWLGKHLHDLAGGVFNLQDALVAARVFLYGLGAYHHIVESFATKLETTHRIALYKAGFASLYEETLGTDDCIEEALASAYGVRKALAVLKKRRGWSKREQAALKTSLGKYTRTNPPGYRNAERYFALKKFHETQLDFAEENHFRAIPKGTRLGSAVWEAFPRAFGPISNILSRVNYIVHRRSRRAPWLERFKI